MDKSNCEKYDSEWMEDEQFKKILHEYVEADAYDANQDNNLRIYITYQTLYKIYTTTLNTKANIQKFDEDLDKLNECFNQIEAGLTSFGCFMMEQDKINRTIHFNTKIFMIFMICWLFLFIYCTYKVIF